VEPVRGRGVLELLLGCNLSVDRLETPIGTSRADKLAPPSFSSCSPSFPLGAWTPRGGGFEKPIGKTLSPAIRSTPVGAIVTTATAYATEARAPAARTAAFSASMS
jgi:hypothetical protein